MPVNDSGSSVVSTRLDIMEAITEFDFSSAGFVATQLMPIFDVVKKEQNISVITAENAKRVDTDHANGSAYERVRLDVSDHNYSCKERGLEIPLTNEDIALYKDQFDAEVESAMAIYRRLLVEREIAVKDAIMNETLADAASCFEDESSAPWDTTTTDIPAQIGEAIYDFRGQCGYMPDTIVIPEAVMANVIQNTKVIARFPGAPVITLDMMKQYLGSSMGLNLVAPGAMYDSAAYGEDFTAADIWSDDYVALMKVQSGSTKLNPGFGRIFNWSGTFGGDSYGVIVEDYEEPQSDSVIQRVRMYDDVSVFDQRFRRLIQVDA